MGLVRRDARGMHVDWTTSDATESIAASLETAHNSFDLDDLDDLDSK